MRVEFGLSFMFSADWFPRTQILEIYFRRGGRDKIFGNTTDNNYNYGSSIDVIRREDMHFSRNAYDERCVDDGSLDDKLTQKIFKKICESLTRTENIYACVDINIILGECMYVLYGRRPRCFCELHHVTETTDLEKLNVQCMYKKFQIKMRQKKCTNTKKNRRQVKKKN